MQIVNFNCVLNHGNARQSFELTKFRQISSTFNRILANEMKLASTSGRWEISFGKSSVKPSNRQTIKSSNRQQAIEWSSWYGPQFSSNRHFPARKTTVKNFLAKSRRKFASSSFNWQQLLKGIK